MPCDSAEARERLLRTVKSGISIDELDIEPPPPHTDRGVVRLWATTEEEEGSWSKVSKGDYLLFYTRNEPDENPYYNTAAKVIGREENRKLAGYIFPDPDEDSLAKSSGIGDRLIYLQNPVEIEITTKELATYYEYVSEGPHSFQRLDNPAMEAIREDYDTVEEYVKKHIPNQDTSRPLDIPTIEDEERYRETIRQLESKGQVVFYGPPGTGKTYHALQYAKAWLGQQNNEPTTENLQKVTFHPSFTYEDFIEGLSVSADSSDENSEHNLRYELRPGIFKDTCELAREEYENSARKKNANKYVLVIDEMNRANISQVFGELVTLLEKDKRGEKITLAHSKDKEFSVPPNLYIIGTMNTSDQSIALIDSAIRRRFRFIRFGPDYEYLREVYSMSGQDEQPTNLERRLQLNSIDALEVINDRILDAVDLGQGKQIGHSYLLSDSEPQEYDLESLHDAWKYEILPLIEEYYFGDFYRIRDQVFAEVDEQLTHPSRPEFRSDFTLENLDQTLRGLVDT
ncbi:McrB family protein [Natronocalculus amylovorans]|uniref:AAA family ATPase n=1 Tax=Natronocalculus amylovorans TaxID=2917812 RepID=A0AAE3FYX7_9EURY|nr:AAA family ATPase [Natronocalculus amylovorans]MCL9817770.1 AAA family ATPase [Natronocalculus amylovorans]